ncbi:hypothetical protein DK766_03760 [Salmonella enterica subsp. enterica serovar Coeln]|nr:hypothetical protein [Salmonella enterica subsp. enterica serovar Coeln]EBN1382545.1 hypothetical protein [Salmonella enterica]EAA4157866.1 hypothetical protein [Salmonella enterica subsp. enterica serovar Coeln]EAA6334472.1 hypothetical protein [Salmonella enterica subsp. enterica serovar Coeln]EBQ6240594.1 hypothetical protein [Salmonella enterica subsp. enterica serovar Coeln]
MQHWWCTARSVTAFAITDFIYSDDSFDRLSSIRYTTYLPTSHVISDNHLNENTYQQCEIFYKNVWPKSIKCVTEPPIHFTILLTNSLLWKNPCPKKQLNNVKNL